jgi:hypothetical protein
LAIWYIFANLVVIWCIFPLLVYCVKKNLATLIHTITVTGIGTYICIALIPKSNIAFCRKPSHNTTCC